jgi:hypothetical protein
VGEGAALPDAPPVGVPEPVEADEALALGVAQRVAVGVLLPVGAVEALPPPRAPAAVPVGPPVPLPLAEAQPEVVAEKDPLPVALGEAEDVEEAQRVPVADGEALRVALTVPHSEARGVPVGRRGVGDALRHALPPLGVPVPSALLLRLRAGETLGVAVP